MISFGTTDAGSPGPGDDFDLPAKLYRRILEQVGTRDFDTWFQNTPCAFSPPNHFILTVRNNFQRAWIQNAYGELLESCAREICGREPLILLELPKPLSAPPILENSADMDQNAFLEGDPIQELQAPGAHQAPRRGRSRHSTATDTPARCDQMDSRNGGRHGKSSPGLIREYTFQNFVEPSGPTVAYAAALAVAEHPGRAYNPLYIHGKTGIGKTHLLQAVFHQIAAGSRLHQIFVNAESFTTQFTKAAEHRDLPSFRKRYRSADVLFLEDIHFLPPKSKTQEEFLQTARALVEKHRQVVISSNCPPSRLKVQSEGLLTLFDGGLIAQLPSPDFDARLKVLARKALARQLELPQETVHFLAQRTSNFHELDGALTTLRNLASAHGRPLTLDLAREALGDLHLGRGVAISVDAILQTISHYYGHRVRDLLSNSKVRNLVYARQIGMYLARELTSLSLEQIGLRFGGRDHTTVIYAQNCIRRYMKLNPQVRAEVDVLRSRLTESHSL